jgi:hypothetical protein
MGIKNRVVLVGLTAGLLAGGGAGFALTSSGVAHGDSATTTTTTKDGTKSNAGASNARNKFLEDALAPLVANGTITQAQADAVIKAIEDARPDRPDLKRFEGRRGVGVLGDVFGAAAKALGMSTDDLRAALRDGKSIADVAKDKNVETSKVVDAMVAAAKTELDQAVKDGKLTQAQADEKLNDLRTRLTAMVNGEMPSFAGRPGFPGHGHGPGPWHHRTDGANGGEGGNGQNGNGGTGNQPSSTNAVFSGTV